MSPNWCHHGSHTCPLIAVSLAVKPSHKLFVLSWLSNMPLGWLSGLIDLLFRILTYWLSWLSNLLLRVRAGCHGCPRRRMPCPGAPCPSPAHRGWGKCPSPGKLPLTPFGSTCTHITVQYINKQVNIDLYQMLHRSWHLVFLSFLFFLVSIRDPLKIAFFSASSLWNPNF